MSLHDTAGILLLATQRLEAQWDHTRNSWTDAKSREYANMFHVPLVDESRQTQRAMGKLAELFENAQGDVRDR